MDDIFIHLKPLPRRMPTKLPVVSIGYLSAKKNRMQHVFGTVNFSFILSGRGFLTQATKS